MIRDVRQIQGLINGYATQGEMLPRTLNDIFESLRDFLVFEQDGQLEGVCALHISWEGLAELRSLAVVPERKNRGIGTELVRSCLEEAKALGASRVFVLTYQQAFFRKLGFHEVDKKELPHKVWTDCVNCIKFPNCDETALIRDV